MRAPFQVLIIPFIKKREKYHYAIFKRKDLQIWQFIAGGGEGNEKPVEAMRREAYEEIVIDRKSPYLQLSSIATIPAVNIRGLKWGNIVMIPEIAFGIEVFKKKLKIGHEHTKYLWLNCQEALEKLEYDSNKSALWELNYRLKNGRGGVLKNIQSIEKYYLSNSN
jgi:dATP pyrophosphohydrolase